MRRYPFAKGIYYPGEGPESRENSIGKENIGKRRRWLV